MVRIAIVEDDLACAQQLQDYVQRYAGENQVEIHSTHFPDGIDITDDYRPVWDIILMDIEMPHLDGMAAARRIREQDPAVVLIFVTNMARYAIHGYEVDAMDFVLKPVKYPQFSLKLKKAVTVAGRRASRYIMVSTDGLEQRLSTEDILYIEVFNHRLHLHTGEAEYILRGSLQDMEEQLAGLPFVRCSHSYLVNLANVIGTRKGMLLVPGHEIPISRPKQKEVLRQLSDYMGGGFR